MVSSSPVPVLALPLVTHDLGQMCLSKVNVSTCDIEIVMVIASQTGCEHHMQGRAVRKGTCDTSSLDAKLGSSIC